MRNLLGFSVFGDGKRIQKNNEIFEIMERKNQERRATMMEFIEQMQSQNQATMNMVCRLVPFYIIFSENIYYTAGLTGTR